MAGMFGHMCNMFSGSGSTVMIDHLLSWLTPIDRDFGPFHVALVSASMEDESATHVDLHEFNIKGVGLHGKVTIDVPGLGQHELPVNVELDMMKAMLRKHTEVNVRDIDFVENDHVDELDEGAMHEKGLLDNLSGYMAGAADGGVMESMLSVVNKEAVKHWACEKISQIINEKIAEQLGDEEKSSEEGSP